jgi:hypothetical protein
VSDGGVDHHGRRCELDLGSIVPLEFGKKLPLGDGDPAEVFEEVEVEKEPAKLAVGYPSKADLLLLFHKVGDGFVFCPAKVSGFDQSFLTLPPGGSDLGRTEEASDMVGPKGGAVVHFGQRHRPIS